MKVQGDSRNRRYAITLWKKSCNLCNLNLFYAIRYYAAFLRDIVSDLYEALDFKHVKYKWDRSVDIVACVRVFVEENA